MSVQTAYAYRDDGFMANWSKWKPRQVQCTRTADHQDLPGRKFVVKYAREAEGCACTISELICTQLLLELGIQTLNPFIIEVSAGFAGSCNLKSDFPYKISPGPHFGTEHDPNVENGPPVAIDDLAEPFDIVLLWVADTWMGNIDREKYGNILLKPAGSGRFQVIAADQSDCFCGTAQFCGAGFPEVFVNSGRASAPPLLAAAIYQTGGTTGLAEAIRKVQQIRTAIPSVFPTVPPKWWSESKIDQKRLANALYVRSERLTEIINPGAWGVPDGLLV